MPPICAVTWVEHAAKMCSRGVQKGGVGRGRHRDGPRAPAPVPAAQAAAGGCQSGPGWNESRRPAPAHALIGRGPTLAGKARNAVVDVRHTAERVITELGQHGTGVDRLGQLAEQVVAVGDVRLARRQVLGGQPAQSVVAVADRLRNLSVCRAATKEPARRAGSLKLVYCHRKDGN